MSDAPPPQGPPPPGPPPGWYPDPQAGGEGYRWWDGSGWTDHHSRHQPAGADRPRRAGALTSAGDWLGQLVRLSMSRAGHFYPLIALLIVPITVVSAFPTWAAFHGATMELVPEVGQPIFDNPDGHPLWYSLSALATIGVLVGHVILLVAGARQAQSVVADGGLEELTQAQSRDREPAGHDADTPSIGQPWSTSLTEARPRLARALALSALLAGTLAGLQLVVVAAAAVAPTLASLANLMVLVASVVIVLRLCLTNIVVALAPRDTPALRTSWELTRGHALSLLGRMLLLVVLSFSLSTVVQLVGSLFVALAGGVETPLFEEGSTTLHLAGALTESPLAFAVAQLFNALAAGASMVVWTVGFVLIYRDLSGPVTDDGDLAPELV